MAVGVPIPSLATIFSIPYSYSKTRFHSVSFQKLWMCRDLHLGWKSGEGICFEWLSIPPSSKRPVGPAEGSHRVEKCFGCSGTFIRYICQGDNLLT
jgi:hypothetical protein